MKKSTIVLILLLILIPLVSSSVNLQSFDTFEELTIENLTVTNLNVTGNGIGTINITYYNTSEEVGFIWYP